MMRHESSTPELAREKLRPSVAEAQVASECNDGHDNVVLLDTAVLQFLDELDVEVCLLLLGSWSACDAMKQPSGAIDIESVILDDEVRFGVLLIDLVTVT